MCANLTTVHDILLQPLPGLVAAVAMFPDHTMILSVGIANYKVVPPSLYIQENLDMPYKVMAH
jgi:hypothetical protein